MTCNNEEKGFSCRSFTRSNRQILGKKINREDATKNCFFPLRFVTVCDERKVNSSSCNLFCMTSVKSLQRDEITEGFVNLN